MNQNYLLLFFLLLCQLVAGQKDKHTIPDSLQNKSYTYLDDKVYEFRKDSAKAAVYLYAYLHKATNEQNWKEVVNAYQNLLHQSGGKLRLVYAHSMLYAAKKLNDNATIGSAYLSKGIEYYRLKQQNNALDQYIIANGYISGTTDNYLIYKLKYHIALVKYYLGYYDEAISLLRECISYFKAENPRPYLNSLHSLGLCYNRAGNYGLCTQTNTLGLKECKRLDIKEMEVYFIHSEGINAYFKQNYGLAIKNIEATIEDLKEKKDFGNESVGYFYIGKSYWQVKKYEKAIPYFEKVDYLFNAKGYLRPDLREVYELLINYYKTMDNPKRALYYIEQLLKADTYLNETFKYLVGKINKEYNTQALLIEKQKLQNQLIKKNKNYSVLIGFTSLLSISFVFLTYRYFAKRKFYEQKFDELMQRINSTSEENEIKMRRRQEKPLLLDIHPETVSMILKQLEKFEKDKKFLAKDWNLSKLSTAFKSNPTYLSAIIHHYKEKRFSEYINDLKIDYLISLLYTDKKTRNFTNKALAQEAGFSTTQLFAESFKKRAGMSTAYFIERIQKESRDLN